MKKLFMSCLAASVAVLSGCATPKDRCISNATQQYRSVESALATAEGNITRGYAIHTQRVPYTVNQTCFRTDPYTKMTIPYSCPSTQYRTETTPVAIDIAEERQKAAQYRNMLPELRRQATQGVQQCNAQFPE